MTQQARPGKDQDLAKGAVEGPPSEHESGGNPNAPAIDDEGLPDDEVAVAEDVIGANVDETQG
jgi:hypothetical protein